jgi:hypothetical protein
MQGDKEEELLENTKKHGIDVHGHTEDTWNKEKLQQTRIISES